MISQYIAINLPRYIQQYSLEMYKIKNCIVTNFQKRTNLQACMKQGLKKLQEKIYTHLSEIDESSVLICFFKFYFKKFFYLIWLIYNVTLVSYLSGFNCDSIARDLVEIDLRQHLISVISKNSFGILVYPGLGITDLLKPYMLKSVYDLTRESRNLSYLITENNVEILKRCVEFHLWP